MSDPIDNLPKESEEELRAWEENLRKTNPEHWEIYLGIYEQMERMKMPPDERGYRLLPGEWVGDAQDDEDDDTPQSELDKDPEGWRIYADVIDEAQIAWLRRNPQYDYSGHVARYDARRAREKENEAGS